MFQGAEEPGGDAGGPSAGDEAFSESEDEQPPTWEPEPEIFMIRTHTPQGARVDGRGRVPFGQPLLACIANVVVSELTERVRAKTAEWGWWSNIPDFDWRSTINVAMHTDEMEVFAHMVAEKAIAIAERTAVVERVIAGAAPAPLKQSLYALPSIVGRDEEIGWAIETALTEAANAEAIAFETALIEAANAEAIAAASDGAPASAAPPSAAPGDAATAASVQDVASAAAATAAASDPATAIAEAAEWALVNAGLELDDELAGCGFKSWEELNKVKQEQLEIELSGLGSRAPPESDDPRAWGCETAAEVRVLKRKHAQAIEECGRR